jgi:sporulation protein YlmC with PRC-barrel domain
VTEARRLWATLSLLDRQLVDRDGDMAGKVDDVELEMTSTGHLLVIGLRSGPGTLARRLGAPTLGGWLERAHRQVDHDGADHTFIPLSRVGAIGARIRLSLDRTEVATFHLERWTSDHVIGHIPGADRAAE